LDADLVEDDVDVWDADLVEDDVDPMEGEDADLMEVDGDEVWDGGVFQQVPVSLILRQI